MYTQWLLKGCVVGLMIMTSACFRAEILTARIDVPQMGSAECRRLVMRGLETIDQEAIRQVELDTEQRVAIITYDSSSIRLKNIEHAIRAAGFDANDVVAEPEARDKLPASCR